MKTGEISLTDGALRAGLTYHQLRAYVLSNRVVGRRDARGRWVVQVASLERFRREMAGEDADSPPIDLASFRRFPEPAA